MFGREEIVAGLELCAKGCNSDGCAYNEAMGECDPFECPPRCIDLLAGDALEYIKELEGRLSDRDRKSNKGP